MARIKYIKCPGCGHANSAQVWDMHTKEQEHIQEDDPYISIAASPEEHEEVDSRFRCPTCNEELPGLVLTKQDSED